MAESKKIYSKKILSKLLTKTDIYKRFAIPGKNLSDLQPDFNGSHAVTIPLRCGTRVCRVALTIRKKKYKKPVFSGGWRKLVTGNNFEVGDELTLYKVQDEADSFHYMVQVEKPGRPSGCLFPHSCSLNHEVDETTGTSRTKTCNFQNDQEQLLMADATIKQEEANTELAVVAADAPVAFVDQVIAKPPRMIFGTKVSDEATGRARFKTKHESKLKSMGEPPLHNEEREINFFALAEDAAMGYGTSQAVRDAYYKSRTERLNLDLIPGLPVPYAGEVNLDLTLAPPLVEMEDARTVPLKTMIGRYEIKQS